MQFTDEHLNYWGDIYCHGRLWEYDLPFAVFVRNPWNADPNDEWLIVAKGDSQLGSLFGEEKKGRVWNALDRSAGLINDACMFRRENKIYLNKTKLFWLS